MKTLKLIIFVITLGLNLSACTSINPTFSRPYLHHAYPLKQDMYVCEVQYRELNDGYKKDRYFMRDRHVFNTNCEDAMYSLGYRTQPALWAQGRGDSIVREWFVARLPKGTLFVINEYDVPNPYSESYTNAHISIVSGKYTGLAVEWPWFDFTREIDRPFYPNMNRDGYVK